MGETFCNLNIKTEDLLSVRALFPGCAAVAAVPGWVTVAGERLRLGTIRREARRASRALPCPVLSTEFFDGDFARFSLFQEGRQTADHIPAAFGDFHRWPGKPKAWAEALGLSQEDQAALRMIFREESPTAALELLGAVLGCPLWADAESIDELSPPDRAYLEDYLARRRAEDNIKNQTGLTLLDQVTAPCDPDWDANGFPFVLREGLETNVYAFWDVRDGRFVKLFERTFSEDDDLDSDWDDASPLGSEVLGAFKLKLLRCGPGRGPRPAVLVFSDTGELLDDFTGEERDGLGAGPFLDSDRYLMGSVCRNIRTHENEWDLGPGYVFTHAVCRAQDGRLITLSKDPGEDLWSLLSFRPDGTDVIRQRLLSIYHWDRALTDRTHVYFAQNERLCCMDSRLTPLWDMDLGETMEQRTYRPLMDTRSRRVWYETLRGITGVDLASRRVAARLEVKPPEHRSLWDILPGVGVLTAASPSSFEVRDLSLNLISRHKTRGTVYKTLQKDGRTLLITAGRSGREPYVKLRLYALELRRGG